jgi:hypothetical protein
MVVEQEAVSLSNPRQGEPAFTGDGLLQGLHTCISCPCSSNTRFCAQNPASPRTPVSTY